MSGIAFHYRRHRGDGTVAAALIGGTIRLEERIEYIVEFPAAPEGPLLQRLREVGFDRITATTGVLSFGNFIGTAPLAGVHIEVVSTKLGAGGASALLQDVSALASALVFGWKSPTGFAGAGRTGTRAPVPYHQLQRLRHAMLLEPPGRRLQDHLATVERNPTRRFLGERSVVGVERVRRLDGRAVQSIFARSDRLAPVPDGSPVAGSPLAAALTFGTPPAEHFPVKVAAPRGRLSFDTLENRFVKHLVLEALALVQRFIERREIHESLRRDCRAMLAILEPVAAAPFLVEAGRLTSLTAPTQVLAKADGYKDLFDFWLALAAHTSLPSSAAETAILLEGRDMARLYELWVFLQVVQATFDVAGASPPGRMETRRSELGETIDNGLRVTVAPGLAVLYNPTFTRSARLAYSTPLRPDVVIEAGGVRHAFDAKYRLDRLDVSDEDADDGAATYKRADLYKMHTYRDAIAEMRTAFVVYPGSEFVFFERGGTRRTAPGALAEYDGVGALPLRPNDNNPAAALREVIGRLLSVTQLAPAAP